MRAEHDYRRKIGTLSVDSFELASWRNRGAAWRAIPKEIIEDASPRVRVHVQIGPTQRSALEYARASICGGLGRAKGWYSCCVRATRKLPARRCPPGALRHHKAYGAGVVPVLKPASNTVLRLAPPSPFHAHLARPCRPRAPFRRTAGRT